MAGRRGPQFLGQIPPRVQPDPCSSGHWRHLCLDETCCDGNPSADEKSLTPWTVFAKIGSVRSLLNLIDRSE